MYTPAISILLVSIFLFIVNIIIFLDDYKEIISYPQRKNKLYLNGCVVIFTIAMMVMGIVYIFTVNNQL